MGCHTMAWKLRAQEPFTWPWVSFVEGALLQELSAVPLFNPDTGRL